MESSKRALAFSVIVVAIASAAILMRAAAQVALFEPALLEAAFAGPLSGHGGGGHAQGPGYLGVMVRDISEGEVSSLHLKSAHGAEVTMVDHDGPACKAGLREHDVITNLNGIPVDGGEQLRHMLHDLQPGRSVSLVLTRGGAEQTINAVMQNRAELEKRAWEQHWVVPEPVDDASVPASSEPSSSPRSGFGHGFMAGHLLPLTPAYTGVTVDALGSQLADYFGVKDGKGLLVHDVESNSPAAQAGLHAGDVITRLNGNRVASKSDWTRAMHDSKGHPVSVTVIRDRHEQTLTMVPDAKHRSAVEMPSPPAAERGWTPVMLQ